jgi:hypothetical protein|nr:MAG TPA: hypothetical protein [Caudoviricetes sp.]
MKIETGLSIPIERNGKHVGSLHFNPDDVCFVERVYDLIGELEQAEKAYEAKAKELEADKAVDEYGILKNIRACLQFLREVCEDLYAKIDTVFGTGTSEMVFGGALSLSAIEQFFTGLAPHFEKVRADKMAPYLSESKRALTK